jgi:hypothetical protein
MHKNEITVVSCGEKDNSPYEWLDPCITLGVKYKARHSEVP